MTDPKDGDTQGRQAQERTRAPLGGDSYARRDAQ